MRRIITVAAAALICGAGALDMAAQTSSRIAGVPKTAAPRKAAGMPGAEFTNDTWTDIGTGKFCDPAMVNMFDNYTTDEVDVQVEESEQHPGVYRVVNPWPAPSHPEANYMIVDARDPEYVHIPAQITPVYEAKDGVTWICSQSYYGLEIADNKDTKEEFLEYFGKYNITRDGDMITFPAGCVMYMWPNATSSFANPGEWVVAYAPKNSGYLVLPGGSSTDQWVDLGKGEMMDGFLYSFINPAVESVVKDVYVLANTRKPGMYKLEKPFMYISADCKDMIIDATDPDFVRIFDQDSGIGIRADGEDWGTLWMYSFSSLSNFPNLDALEATGYGHLNITLKDDIINIPPQAIVFYFPKVDELSYYNNDQAIESYIKLPSSASVEAVDTDQTAPEYYTLQGLRVERPVPGQMVIVRQGGKTTKRIVR